MHDEAGFLAAIRETPADDTARLVFADWLEEQDDPTCTARAAFVRLELRLTTEPADAPDRAEQVTHLRELAADQPHLWLATVSHAPVECCRAAHKFTCPGRWHLLNPTSFDDIRRCGACKRSTRFCATLGDANQQARTGNSVVVSPAVERQPNDLVAPHSPQRIRLTPELIERLRAAGVRGAGPLILPELARSIPAPVVPPRRLNVMERTLQPELRPRHRPKRKKGRHHTRNIQREEWEEE